VISDKNIVYSSYGGFSIYIIIFWSKTKNIYQNSYRMKAKRIGYKYQYDLLKGRIILKIVENFGFKNKNIAAILGIGSLQKVLWAIKVINFKRER